MSSSLPTGDSSRKDVQQFGIGPYDYSSEGEDRDSESASDTLPFGSDTLYAASELPDDGNNPSSRSDYYDGKLTGSSHRSGLNGDEWASEPGNFANSALPGVSKVDINVDNSLSALGNSSSGYSVEDTSDTGGHPVSDVYEVPPRSASEGSSMDRRSWEKEMDKAMKIQDEKARQDAIESLYQKLPGHPRKATNLEQVGNLAKAVIKAHGRKGLTRRHVMAVLQAEGAPQYLASDVVRCLKVRHAVDVRDLLHEFPVEKVATSKPRTASSAVGESVRSKLIELELRNVHRPEVASVLRRCAATMSHVLADLEKLEVRHGK